MTSYIYPQRAERKGRPYLDEQETSRRRQRIIDSAKTFFDAYGLEATPLTHIADAAEVDPKLVYYYFGSKQGLYDTINQERKDSAQT